MPLKNGRMTPGEVAFASAYAKNGGDVAAAERTARVAKGHGYNILRRPEVNARIVAEQRQALTDALPIAVSTMVELMGEKQAGGVRYQAAKYVIDTALGDEAGGAKRPEEMSAEELADAIERFSARAGELAKVVNAEPDIFG